MKPRNPKIELKACWSKKENDIMIHYPCGSDGHFLNNLLNGLRLSPYSKTDAERLKKGGNKMNFWCDSYNQYLGIYEIETFIEALDKRGYDLKTLKFSIKKKKETNNEN